MTHYRAYQQAVERGDLASAEVEAQNALAASTSQHGDGGPTAALAVNLAGIRLARGETDRAIDPARQALRIVEASGAPAGVDPRVVRLILGRAELSATDGPTMDRLMKAIVDARAVQGIEAEAYPAAVELALTAFAARRYPLAREAWVASAGFADGSRINRDYALARAKLGEAAARAAQVSRKRAGTVQAPHSEFEAIQALIAEAMDLVHDQAMRGPRGGELTLAQSVFGEALALNSGLDAKLGSENVRLRNPAKPRKQSFAIEDDDPRPQCVAEPASIPAPQFPRKELVENGLGSVALKLLVDETGAVSRVQVAGSTGGQAFADSVVAAAQKWKFKKARNAAQGCRLTREYFMTVRFLY